MAECNEQHSKSSKRNKRRAKKRTEARIEKLKQDGVIEQIMEELDPIKALKKKLQEAKDNKDHKLAAELRHQIWVRQDEAAGCQVPDLEKHKVKEILTTLRTTEEGSPLLRDSLDLLKKDGSKKTSMTSIRYEVPDPEARKVKENLTSHITEEGSPLLQDTKDVLNQDGPKATTLTSTDKRLRALKKKLRQINLLKEKQSKGEEIEIVQIQKIKSEDAVLAEIKEVEAILARVSL